MSDENAVLVSRVTCPHCWQRFAPHDVLWVSAHTDLLGDPKLGPDAGYRFLPSRFNVRGEAIDARGFPCRWLACPNCHLQLPRTLMEMKPLFFSILGAPFSGKSFFMASMMWALRRELPKSFQLDFADADATFNLRLTEYEERLFVKSDPDKLTPLGQFIEKTQVDDGRLLNRVQFGAQSIEFPQPFVFTVQPSELHPKAAERRKYSRLLCLYDNAGESFQPGMDSVRRPVTQHMACSAALYFVFDPTQDPRFHAACKNQRGATSKFDANRMNRQEHLLTEASVRIRRYANRSQDEKHTAPLVVICSKFDAWSDLIPVMDRREPWRTCGNPPVTGIDMGRIAEVSQAVRKLLLSLTPEIVAAAEGLSREVVYIPTSATGWNTQLDPDTGDFCIRPRDIEPFWITVPFVYGMAKGAAGLVPSITPKNSSGQSQETIPLTRAGIQPHSGADSAAG